MAAVEPHLPAPTAHRAELEEMPRWLVQELRSDHAGETGAVAIYHGIEAVSRNEAVRSFAARHRATEQGHLELMEAIVAPAHRSRLLPLWRLAGWVTGALPALFGPRAVFVTIDAVETFVDAHYSAQIDALDRLGDRPALREILARCRDDELEHRDDARQAAGPDQGAVARAWSWVVGFGSNLGVAVARRL